MYSSREATIITTNVTANKLTVMMVAIIHFGVSVSSVVTVAVSGEM